ncbi:hypothetical protein [Acetivibrio cellulolyticus]|uniref:hypothetical protein n=1 Tax=Acetivibrio cellulolyticus TaxID=35830 RepID=UPI0001E2C1F4|nr:hypothetical protein [Acetivibrio cellulolyticus]
MNIKSFFTQKVNGKLLFGIFLIIWGPFLVYMNYKNVYLYFKYVDYSTYFEYLKAEPFTIIMLLFAPVLIGFCLIYINHKWLQEVVKVISILVFIGSISIHMISQVGFGPGFSDGVYYKRHLDETNSKMISSAIMALIGDSGCIDFNGLYDSSNKNLLNIRQNDSQSVKLLIIALHDKIYYKNIPFGPYLEKLNSDKSIYDEVKPRSTKNAVGYRIEIDNGFVKCIPVFNVKEAIIVIK